MLKPYIPQHKQISMTVNMPIPYRRKLLAGGNFSVFTP